MGEEREDQQKLKRIAAAAFDYENDPRWADYWSNILIPPHLASRSDVIDHFKRKFYQRYIDPDLVVEAMSTNGSSQSTKSSGSSSSSSAPSNDQPRPRNTGSTTRTSGPSATAGQNPSPVRWDRQTIQFSINAWVFIVAVLAIIPLVPKNLSSRASRLSFMGTACSSLYSLYALHGRPRAWNLQGIQAYLQSIIATKDFIYVIYCLTFVTSHLCLRFALIPILCRSLEHVAKFLRCNFSRSTLYSTLKTLVYGSSPTQLPSTFCPLIQIALGFLLIISLLSWQRNIIQTFMYWQLLKLMYNAPVTAGYHQSVWAKIGRIVNPHIHRYCPFLNTPLSAVQRWWFR